MLLTSLLHCWNTHVPAISLSTLYLAVRMLKRLLMNMTLLVVGCVIALAVFEGLLRYYEPVPMRLKGNKIQLTSNQTMLIKLDDREKYSKFDPVIAHSKNSLGFRGEDPPLSFEQHLTLMTVGGSTTECYYLSDGKTWTDLLGKELGQNFNNVWVNNAGLDGHSTFGHIHLLKEYIADIRPKVILYLIGINDIGLGKSNPFDDSFINTADFWKAQPDAPSIWQAVRQRHGVLTALAYYSETANLVLNIARSMRAVKGGMGHAQIDFMTIPTLNVTPAESEAELDKQRELYLPSYESRLRQLIALTKKADIAPVLITQPTIWGDGIDPTTGIDLKKISGFYGDRMELYNDVTRRVGAELGVFVIDLAKLLPDDSKYFYDWFHFTNVGAAKVGAIVTKALSPWLAENFQEYVKN